MSSELYSAPSRHHCAMADGPGSTPSTRPAAEGDAAAIAAIYNEGIADRVATFETRLRGPEEVARWLDDGLPLLVAVDAGGAVLGFARAAPYSDRCVYAGVAEHGVYVARGARGGGLARLLL